MKKIILIIFILSNNLMGTIAANITLGKMLTQAELDYEQTLKAFKEMTKQTNKLQKQLEGIDGVRKNVSDVKKSIYGEIDNFKRVVDNQRKAMKKMVLTMNNTDKNFASMFDFSDGNYYSGKLKNQKMEELLATIKENINANLNKQREENIAIDVSEMDDTEKEFYFAKKEKRETLLDEYTVNLGGNIAYNSFQEYMEDKINKKVEIEKEIEEMQQALATEKSIRGQTVLTNRIMIMILELLRTSSKHTQEYQTAMLMKNYNLVSTNGAKLAGAKYIINNEKVNKAYNIEKVRKLNLPSSKGMSFIEIIHN